MATSKIQRLNPHIIVVKTGQLSKGSSGSITEDTIAQAVPSGYEAIGLVGVQFTNSANLQSFSYDNGNYAVNFDSSDPNCKAVLQILCMKV